MFSSLPLRSARIPFPMNPFTRFLRHGFVLPQLLWLVAFASCVSALHADPPGGKDWTPIPQLTDEFEGDSLDAARWHDHNPGWHGRKPGLFSRSNVEIKDGQLHLTARAEDVGEWNKKLIRWYVDGQVVRELENTHWHQPLHLNFDSETMPDWFGLPKKEELPARFSIEYVRAWKEKTSG
jgi:hypothetical protein